ncbi:MULTISPECIES: diacylglycerol kinase [unclassified Marinimicrobium]|uniref:diacylglycerol kinase n=1 Tax=Marinimicrobium TaxID=359337 RepID=UPI0004671601|nr:MULTISPECIES: diacylglycerol kinase [unclassified Marinimicrobium]MAN52303.1 diacylglycerol kinase [Marinimicrobium sp.]
MPKPGKTGLRRIVDAFGYSMHGFAAAWRFEAAFRQEVLLAVILLPASLWLGTTLMERLLLVASVFWVIMAELANSAIEAAIDRTGDEMHVLAGRAKDMGSALVLVSLILLAIIWVSVGAARFL